MLPTLENMGEIDPRNLAMVLGDKSDLAAKSLVKPLPHMMFTEENCNLYDNVRPIKWQDPNGDAVRKSSQTFRLESTT